MFNLSGSELVFIAVLGLIVLGPEKLPSAMRRAGKIYREVRNISGNVQREVQKAMAEPVAELKKTQATARGIFEGKMPHLEQAVGGTPTPPPDQPPAGATPSPDQPPAPASQAQPPAAAAPAPATPSPDQPPAPASQAEPPRA